MTGCALGDWVDLSWSRAKTIIIIIIFFCPYNHWVIAKFRHAVVNSFLVENGIVLMRVTTPCMYHTHNLEAVEVLDLYISFLFTR